MELPRVAKERWVGMHEDHGDLKKEQAFLQFLTFIYRDENHETISLRFR